MAGVAAAALLGAAGAANAGGFAVREQSTSAQGASFAGGSVGYDLSGMFWNSAAIAHVKGTNTESHLAVVLPKTEVTGTSTLGGFPTGLGVASGDIADPAFIPASYGAMQLTGFDPNLWIGVAINSPFGLTTKPDNINYAGGVIATTSKLFTVNVNPTVAYRFGNVSVGVGAQIQYATARLNGQGFGPLPAFAYEGDEDYGFGVTAGITVDLVPGTVLGLGYRSQIEHDIDGTFTVTPPGAPLGRLNATANLTTPDIVTLTLRSQLSQDFTLLGTVEWSNWTINNPITLSVTGQPDRALQLVDQDGWMFALGGEYAYSPELTLRAGAAYEISPTDEAFARSSGLPDTDRIWLSAGATYKWSEKVALDFAYTHIFFEDGDIERESLLNPAYVFIGEVENSLNIVSASVKVKWGAEDHETLK